MRATQWPLGGQSWARRPPVSPHPRSGGKAVCHQVVRPGNHVFRSLGLVTDRPQPSTENTSLSPEPWVCRPGSSHGPHRLLCPVLSGVPAPALWPPRPAALLLPRGKAVATVLSTEPLPTTSLHAPPCARVCPRDPECPPPNTPHATRVAPRPCHVAHVTPHMTRPPAL